LNTTLQKFAEERKYLNNALSLSKEIGHKEWMKLSYAGLSQLDSTLGNWKSAYQYHKLYSEIEDTLFNEESSKQMTEMSTKYETEKKQKEIELLQKDGEIQKSEVRRQKVVKNAVLGGLVAVLLFSFVLINRLLLIRKQKKVIEIEREKSEKLLLNILPKEIAEELKQNTRDEGKRASEEGKPSSDTHHSSLALRPRWLVTPKRYDQVTVMFTDFKGFTTIAEKLSAEELVSELDFLFKKFDEIISKYNIEKIKTIGDAYMCASGLPTPNSNHAENIVSAALEIQNFMKELAIGNWQLANENGNQLRTANWKLRIGIHSGPVTAGVVGDKKFAYDIWGDAVNTASRMESSGEEGKINISGATYNLIKDKLQTTNYQLQTIYRGEIEAKNKGKIKMYFVERKNN